MRMLLLCLCILLIACSGNTPGELENTQRVCVDDGVCSEAEKKIGDCKDCVQVLSTNPCPNELVCGQDCCASGEYCNSDFAVAGKTVYECRVACVDSDDGLDPNTKGEVSKKGRVSRLDTCGPDGQVVEYYCNSDTMDFRYMTCEEGKICKEGACVKNDGVCEQLTLPDWFSDQEIASFESEDAITAAIREFAQNRYVDYAIDRIDIQTTSSGGWVVTFDICKWEY